MQKKAAAYIGYVMLIMITVAIAAGLIIWSKKTTEEFTESTVKLASGRLECREVKIDAKASPDCNFVTISNRGFINIENAKVTFDDARQKDSGKLTVESSIDVFDEELPYSKVTVLPIVKERENLFGCTDKKLVVEC